MQRMCGMQPELAGGISFDDAVDAIEEVAPIKNNAKETAHDTILRKQPTQRILSEPYVWTAARLHSRESTTLQPKGSQRQTLDDNRKRQDSGRRSCYT